MVWAMACPGFQSQLRRSCDGNGPFKRHVNVERIPGAIGAICCRRGNARYACTVINIDRLGAGFLSDYAKGNFSEVIPSCANLYIRIVNNTVNGLLIV